MTNTMIACEYCDAVVTAGHDPDHDLIMHVQVTHDDDCRFYRKLTVNRAERRATR